MYDLNNLQGRFLRATLKGETAALAALISEDRIDASSRLQIHRNNTFITLTDALGATFPVVKRLLGDDFFDFMAHRYIEQSPPTPGPLFNYGKTLADFITGFEPAAELAYLADVARLEWALNDAYYAIDAAPLDARDLTRLPSEALPDLTFKFHPSHRLLVSNYAVDKIWRANQPGLTPDFITMDGDAHMLVVRPHFQVELHSITAGAFGFLVALAMGQTISVAVDAARARDPAFETAETLSSLLSTGVFTSTKFYNHKEQVT